jgi:hypothetical protein
MLYFTLFFIYIYIYIYITRKTILESQKLIKSILTCQILGLFPIGHQFESHKLQVHWSLTWLLTSRPVGLVEVRVSWSGHQR